MNDKQHRIEKCLRTNRLQDKAFLYLSYAVMMILLLTLGSLIVDVFSDGIPRLSWQFLTSFPSRHPAKAGIIAALAGSSALIALTIIIAIPLGVAAAIYLEEFAKKNWFSTLIEINIANLAGVPSIIYGLMGLELFVRFAQLGRSLLAGALCLSLLILPIIIISSREALKTVPSNIRLAAYALGATKWETVQHHILPGALPGILTGAILSVSRAIGETAPLIVIGALTFVSFLPDSVNSPFSALPIQIFNWVSRPQKAFADNAAAGIVVLLVILLLLNGSAAWIRARYQQK